MSWVTVYKGVSIDGVKVEWKPDIFRKKYPCQERRRGADSLRW